MFFEVSSKQLRGIPGSRHFEWLVMLVATRLSFPAPSVTGPKSKPIETECLSSMYIVQYIGVYLVPNQSRNFRRSPRRSKTDFRIRVRTETSVCLRLVRLTKMNPFACFCLRGYIHVAGGAPTWAVESTLDFGVADACLSGAPMSSDSSGRWRRWRSPHVYLEFTLGFRAPSLRIESGVTKCL